MKVTYVHFYQAVQGFKLKNGPVTYFDLNHPNSVGWSAKINDAGVMFTNNAQLVFVPFSNVIHLQAESDEKPEKQNSKK